jgi:hypothetical protein
MENEATNDEALVTKPSDADLVALARRTPITRGGIAELAKKLPAKLDHAEGMKLVDRADSNSAMAIAFALAAGGKKVPTVLTLSLLAEVLSLDHIGPLVFATDADTVDVFLAFLSAELGDLELECLVTLLAAEALGPEKIAAGDIPRPLLSRGRWLARHRLSGDAAVYLGGAAIRLKDPDLTALAQPHVNRAKRAKKTIDDAIATAKLPILDVLDDVDGARVSAGFTVRHDTPSVGRNDPCPCGSGKKYKKCHALAETGPGGGSTEAPQIPKLDPRTIGAEQAALLRPSEMRTLETAKLSPTAFTSTFGRAVDLRQWELALRMIDEARSKADVGIEAVALAIDALHAAYDARAHDAAEQLHATLPPEIAEEEELAIECVRASPDLLETIEKKAEDALRRDADGARGMLLASALLRWFPALGIYVARGALHEGRRRTSMALLTSIEDARDRLLLSPFEAWWDVFDAIFEDDEDRREQEKQNAAREKMKADLRRARAASRKTAAEMEKLERRVAELDVSMATPTPTPTPTARPKTDVAVTARPSAVDPELAEERRRLKTKIDELQRIIGEGQEERRELRRQIADQGEDDGPTSAKPKSAHSPPSDEARDAEGDRDRDRDRDPEGMHDAGSVDLPRAILVPRFSDRASKAVTELAGDAADGVLSVVAALAAGKPNAWGGVKQLTKVRGVLSARAGIHHRVLFSTSSSERSLVVLEVLHRRDLEQVVARLSRVG